jgi:hypothetical protein
MKMKDLKHYLKLWAILIISFLALGILAGCDSGKEAIDDVTGNKTVKQFQKSKKDIDKAVDKQSELVRSIPDETDKKTSEDSGEGQ